MATILSLSKARKMKARSDKEKQAAENRIVFGRSKTEKQKLAAEQALAKSRLDGHRLKPKDISDD